MRKVPVRGILPAIVLLALALSPACSGDDAGTTTPSATPPAVTREPSPVDTPTATATATAAASPTPGPAPGVDWPTQGFDNRHSGYNPGEEVLSVETAPNLDVAWKVDVESWIISQPVFASGVEVAGRGAVDVVYVGNEEGVLFAFDARDPLPEGVDRLIWRTQLGKVLHGFAPQEGMKTGRPRGTGDLRLRGPDDRRVPPRHRPRPSTTRSPLPPSHGGRGRGLGVAHPHPQPGSFQSRGLR